LSWNTTDENMFPCSVTASAGIRAGRLVEQLVDAAGAIEQRVLGVEVKVNEFCHRDCGAA
jgi:hypothetical protein